MSSNKVISLLEQIEARGTPAPWNSLESASGGHVKSKDDKQLYIADCGLPEQGPNNADLIAASRNALPHLLKFVELIEYKAFTTLPGEPVIKQVTLQDIWLNLTNRLDELEKHINNDGT